MLSLTRTVGERIIVRHPAAPDEPIAIVVIRVRGEHVQLGVDEFA